MEEGREGEERGGEGVVEEDEDEGDIFVVYITKTAATLLAAWTALLLNCIGTYNPVMCQPITASSDLDHSAVQLQSALSSRALI